MILFLFSIFNIKKLFSVVSPPTFHLAPRSLNFAELAMHAMKRLQDNGKNNLIYKFALCISSNRPGSNDSLFPINRMPFGMVQYQIELFSATNIMGVGLLSDEFANVQLTLYNSGEMPYLQPLVLRLLHVCTSICLSACTK